MLWSRDCRAREELRLARALKWPMSQCNSRRFLMSDMLDSHLLGRISIDPNICFGKPCIRGTRIWVSLILDFLANGEREADILAAYPQLTSDDIRAALAYGAEVVRERIIPIPVAAAK